MDWPEDTSARWFHHKDGWFFGAREDGTVLIQAPDKTVHEIDKYSWASIIAHASFTGETTFTYETARDFHIGLRPSSV